MTTPDKPAGAIGDPALAARLQLLARRSARVLWLIVFTQGIVLLLAVAGIAVLGSALISAEHRITHDELTTTAAFCDAQFTIATAPLPANATRLGVAFVEASRKAFTVLHCPGHLGTPPASLVKLGDKYAIPIRY